MPRVLETDELDPLAEEVDMTLTLAEEQAAERLLRPVSPANQIGDLIDGGMVGGVRVTPRQNGRRMPRGRATVRRAWMWNGTESMLPLAWNPEGTRHDGARHYLLKRHCICCQNGGFFGAQCPNCARNGCDKCASGTDRTTEQVLATGKTIKGWIIPSFYLSKEQVPFPARFYGSINCFLPFCIRRDDRGFLTENDMRIHARTRHRLEYQAHIESLQAAKTDEVDELRRRIDQMMLAGGRQSAPQRARKRAKSKTQTNRK